MARICGTLGGDLDALVPPLRHSPEYAVATHTHGSFAAATIALPGAVATTDYAEEGERAGVFCGYLLEEGAARPAAALLAAADDPTALARLNGIFVAAVWDGRAEALTLVSDRYGVRPLFFHEQAGRVHFASEIKALLSSSLELRLDEETLEEMACIGSALGNGTLCRGIRRLPPATRLVFTNGVARAERYWWWDRLDATRTTTPERYRDETGAILRTTMRELAARIDTGVCMLSAGFDSRRLLLELHAAGATVRTYTAATPFGVRFEADTAIAAELSRRLGYEHVAAALPAPDEVRLLATVVGTLLDYECDEAELFVPLLGRVPLGVGMNFDGLGGDRLLGEFFHEMPLADACADSDALAARLTPFTGEGLLARPILRAVGVPLHERVRAFLDDLPENGNRVALFYLLTRARRKVAGLPYGMLSTKVDSFCPYLDNRLVEYVFGHDPSIRADRDFQQTALAHDFPAMADIPHSHLPVAQVPRRYLRPIGDWSGECERHRVAESARRIMAEPGARRIFASPVRFQALLQATAGRLPAVSRRLWRLGWQLPRLSRLVGSWRSMEDPEFVRDRLERVRAYVFSPARTANALRNLSSAR